MGFHVGANGDLYDSIQMDDKLVVVEHIPAKVCDQCGERLYSSETVERLQKMV